MNSKAMYKLTYGLFVLTVRQGDKDNGCIINTAFQVTSEPNQICIAVNKANYTHDLLKETGEFTVSAISEKATMDLFKRFGFQSGRTVDKFDGFTGMARGENGIYYVTEGTNSFISVKVEKMEDLGTHTMFIGKVTDMGVLSDAASATYEYYQNNIKPKPQPVGKTEEGETIWRCRICGYEYVGEELPEDFVCPLCNHPASDFEKYVNGVLATDEPEKKAELAKGEQRMNIYKCNKCGTMVDEIKAGGCHPTCCGEPMTLLEPGTSDGAHEKHVPVYKIDGNTVKVCVGEVAHPMLETHYIEWIAIETTNGMQKKVLKPGDVPEAEFVLAAGEELTAVYEYCNLHGLWKA